MASVLPSTISAPDIHHSPACANTLLQRSSSIAPSWPNARPTRPTRQPRLFAREPRAEFLEWFQVVIGGELPPDTACSLPVAPLDGFVEPTDRRAKRRAPDADLALGLQVAQGRPEPRIPNVLHLHVVNLQDVHPFDIEASEAVVQAALHSAGHVVDRTHAPKRGTWPAAGIVTAIGIVVTLLSVALVAPMLRDRAGSPAPVR